MPWLVDLIYLLAAILGSPVWLPRMIATGKIRTDWAGRFGRGLIATADPSRPRILLHAVSVGEANAIRDLVHDLELDHELVIATTTNTGFERARSLYGDRHTVTRYPFDFSFAVRRFLDRVRPDLAVFVELEVWPNMTAELARRGIPMAVVNGRISDRSFPRYRLAQSLVARSFARLALVLAQDETIASRFVELGAAPDRVRVVGTMKWDTAKLEDEVPGAAELARDLGIDRARPVVVAGSTGPGEEALVHAGVPTDVQLIVAPRKPERFDEAAAALPGCVRRTAPPERDTRDAQPPTRFLLDTLGELRAAYSLADVVIVGRTFVDLGGSDMIEPVALGKATIVGPSTANFDAVTRALTDGGGLVQVTRDELPGAVRRLLDDVSERTRLAEAGRAVIRQQQGVTARQAAALRGLLVSGSGDAYSRSESTPESIGAA